MNLKQRKGFTLIEILLVIAAISILAAIVIVAINPAKQLAEARNAQRRSDAKTILDAVQQYAIDNNGTFPGGATMTTLPTPICTGVTASVTACTDATPDYVDLTSATTSLDIAAQKYLVSLPLDPQCTTACATGSIGYSVSVSTNKRVTVSSLHVERMTIATATATVTTGGVVTPTITSAGSGYTTPPTVAVTIGTATCSVIPTATATITSGTVTALTFTTGTCSVAGTLIISIASPIFVSR